jgi:hypothetical protein
MSFIATTSILLLCNKARRVTLPILPKPLIATFILLIVFLGVINSGANVCETFGVLQNFYQTSSENRIINNSFLIKNLHGWNSFWKKQLDL